MRNYLLALILLTMCSTLGAVAPFLTFRSQGFNAARELVLWQTQINKSCMTDWYGSLSATLEFNHSFHSADLAECLFGEAICSRFCDSATFAVQGTKVQGRNPRALMAENFYLPTDFSSEVTVKPATENLIVDFNFYFGLDACVEGLYVRIHAPAVLTRTNMWFCERVINPGYNDDDPGYFNNTFTPATFTDPTVYGLANSSLLHSFEDYIVSGSAITNVPGIRYNPLQNARIDRERLNQRGLAELTMAVGWNFYTGPDYHFGLLLRAAAPTGTRPEGRYLFEPIVGNGKHWELGGGLTTHYRFWENCDATQNLAFWIDANIMHLFKAHQCRTFDLCGKPLSRYMLALRFTDQVDNLTAMVPSAHTEYINPSAQFASEFMPVANISTIPVDVSIGIQADIVCKLSYTYKRFQFDVGYDFWGRSCEKIYHRCDCCCLGSAINDTWGLKGDAFVYGFTGVQNQPTLISQPGIPLSATESQATIFSGTDEFSDPDTWSENLFIDCPKLAYDAQTPNNALFTHTIGTLTSGGDALWVPVNTTFPGPILFTEDDLDFKSAATRGISQKLFVNIGYLWQECNRWQPYVGLGSEIEWGSHSCGSCQTSKQIVGSNGESSCCSCALSQWGIWIKGGVSY